MHPVECAVSDMVDGQKPNIAKFWKSAYFRREATPAAAKDVIGWWETRRIPFNLIVGSAGILSCIVALLVGVGAEILFGSEFGLPDPPIFGVLLILIYGIFANVFYTGGWIAELIVRRIWPREANRFATWSFATGLVLSVLLTLLPGFVIGAAGIFGLTRHVWNVIHRH